MTQIEASGRSRARAALLGAYFAMPACIALPRCMPQAPILPLSIESCAYATSFCAAVLLSPSAMFSIMASVFSRFALLQPALILAAWAGTTIDTTAAITAAPNSPFVMIFPLDWHRIGAIAGSCATDCRRCGHAQRMNFTRAPRDLRVQHCKYAVSAIFMTAL